MSSFRYGRSTSNQRIECWWSLLRKWSSDWWIDLFKMMKEAGFYDDYNQVHQDCLKFCFTEVIQSELNEVCQEWNSHLIRKSRMAETPHGIPDELYFLSQIQGGEDFKKQYDPLDLALAEQYVERAEPAFSRTFLNLMDIIMTEDGLSRPSTPQEALALYVHFCNVIM